MESVIDCPICYDKDTCFEDTQPDFKSYMCFNCGFMSNSHYTENNLDKVEKEDEKIVELVQKGMSSRFYNKGRFSPSMETGVHHFHRLISKFLK